MELTLNIKKIFITVLLISMGIRQNVVINFRDNGDNTFNVDYKMVLRINLPVLSLMWIQQQ
jgi:hypothetical protein